MSDLDESSDTDSDVSSMNSSVSDVDEDDDHDWFDVSDEENEPDSPPADEITSSVVPDYTSPVPESNNNEERPKWKDQLLYPPSKKKTKNPSFVWRYAGFIKKGEKLELDHAICSLCGSKIVYSGSPSNLRKHFQYRHKKVLEAAEKSSKEKFVPGQSQSLLTDFPKFSKPAAKYSQNNSKQRQFRSKLVEWIIDSSRPFDIVGDPKFKEMMNLIDPRLDIPSRHTVARDIYKVFVKKKSAVKEELNDVPYFSATTDAGTSLAGRTYIDLNLHWIDPETFESKKKTINVEKVDSKTADDYRLVVDKSLEDHGVLEKTFCFITDNEATMRKCFPNKERNGCFAHIDSKASQKALESSVKLKTLRKKLRKIAKKANKSSKFKGLISKEQKERNLRVLTLKQEIATRFTCTFDMMKSFLNDPNENKDESADVEKVDANVEAINMALKKHLRKKEFNAMKIEPNDVSLMLKLMPTLEVLEEGIRILGGQSYCSASSVLPFLVQFRNVLEQNEDDPVFISKFKQVLSSELSERCKENLNFSLLAKSSFFDKRFSKVGFLAKLEFPEGAEITKESMIAEVLEELE